MSARGRLAFIIDATASREPTWDMATQLQTEMFEEATKFGSLEADSRRADGQQPRRIGSVRRGLGEPSQR